MFMVQVHGILSGQDSSNTPPPPEMLSNESLRERRKDASLMVVEGFHGLTDQSSMLGSL